MRCSRTGDIESNNKQNQVQQLGVVRRKGLKALLPDEYPSPFEAKPTLAAAHRLDPGAGNELHVARHPTSVAATEGSHRASLSPLRQLERADLLRCESTHNPATSRVPVEGSGTTLQVSTEKLMKTLG